jgi:hypothetical protein
MSSSRCALLAAALVAVPFALIAEEPNTNRSAAQATNQQEVPVVKPTPAPKPSALPPAPSDHSAARSQHPAAARPVLPAAPKAIPTPNPGTWGIVSSGDGGGGIFRDSDSEAEAWLGSDGIGVQGFGSWAGGQFQHAAGLSSAAIAAGDQGIVANGTAAAGYFSAIGFSGYAFLAQGDRGINAAGNDSGGFFMDANGSGSAFVAYDNRGIHASGSEMGGYFEDTDASGFAHIGWGNTGVFGRGNVAGGVFDDGDDSGYARAGWGNQGINAGGHSAGGYFADTDSSGHAYVGFGDTGVLGRGHAAGGVFEDNDGSGYAKIGFDRPDGTIGKGGWDDGGEYGVFAGGDYSGGYFESTLGGSFVYLGWDHGPDLGIMAYGGDSNYFHSIDTGAFAYIPSLTSSIAGIGAVSTVQNHPHDPESVIVYAAPGGNEVATYDRGTARLVNGEARVPLGETFKWVTNPDIGLTAYAMPVGEWTDLYVAEISTEELVIRSRDGAGDGTFHYLVYGLRIGFEQTTVVQEKTHEAYIPSMHNHRDLIVRRPDLAKYTALSRYSTERKSIGIDEPLDISRAHELRDLIQEYDPATHGRTGPGGLRSRRPAVATESVDSEVSRPTQRTGARRARGGEIADPGTASGLTPMLASDPDRDVYARSFRPSAADLASLLEVSEPVEPGDVLAIDPERPGLMRRASTAEDPTVVGVVTASPGVVLGASGTGTDAEAAVAFAGVTSCKVDAGYGPVYPGDLLVTSPTPGHAMRADVPLPGTVLGKALEELTVGSGVIRVLVMLR